MKHAALILLLLSITLAGTKAQRCLPGMKAMELHYGAVDGDWNSRNFYFGIARSQYVENCNKWVFGAEFLTKGYEYRGITIPKVQFTGEAGYYLKILSTPNKFFFLSPGISAVAGYETVNWNDKLLGDGAAIKNKDAFLYGAALTLEAEFFLTDGVVLLLRARERILFGSSIGKFHTQIGFGIKITIR